MLRRAPIHRVGPPLTIAALAALASAGAPMWSTGPGADGFDAPVLALEVFDADGAGPAAQLLIAGGVFQTVGPAAVSSIAAWDGRSWRALGPGIDGAVNALTTFDRDGAGVEPALLIAAGAFTSSGSTMLGNIGAWNGSAWAPLGSGGGIDGPVSALASFDPDGPTGPALADLYVGGFFALAGGVAAQNLALWNGTAWSVVGPAAGAQNQVQAMRVLDPDGSGPVAERLYVGGWFTSIGGITAARVASFDGAMWSSLGSGLGGNFPVYARCFEVFDADGPGLAEPSIITGGFFTSAGMNPALGLARFDGADWSEVQGGVGTPAEARSLAVFDDDGPGPRGAALFVGGVFIPGVGAPGNYMARWTGSAWDTLDGGATGAVNAVAIFDEDGDGPDAPGLYIAGEFLSAGGIPAIRLARWGLPRTSAPFCPDATGDGLISFEDVASVLSNWGRTYDPPTPRGPGDANESGSVDFSDLAAILASWGAECL